MVAERRLRSLVPVLLLAALAAAPPAQAAPPGATTEPLLHLERILVAPAVPTPALGVPFTPTPDYEGTPETPILEVGAVTVADAGERLCVFFTPEGGPTVELTCVNRLLLGAADAAVPRGTTPLLVAPPTDPQEVEDAQAVPLVPASQTPKHEVTVDVSYTYVPGQVSFLVSALTVETWSPFQPTTEGAAWFAANGAELPLTVTVTHYVDGVANDNGLPEQPLTVAIPYLGQLVAAAQQMADVA